MNANLMSLVDAAWADRASISARSISPELRKALEECVALLDSGRARVAEKREGRWIVNEWLKKAVLLFFRANDNQVVEAGFTRFFDKVPLKYAKSDAAAFAE